jgi:DNA replication protein DnaC
MGVFLPHEVYGYDKGYWKDLPQCDCEEKLLEKTEERNRLKSKGEKIRGLIRQVRDSGIGKRYANKTFENFDKSKNKKAYLACLDYTKNFSDNLKSGKGLFITGKVGTGKTHLLAAIVDRLARLHKRKLFSKCYLDYYFDGVYKDYCNYDEYPIIYVPASELFSKIRVSFEDRNTGGIMEKYQNCGLLIIDDLGVEKTTEFTVEYIYKIIDSRYRNLKPVIVTSNLTDDELKEKLSERIISRIYEICKGIKLEGKDYRLEMMGK